MTIELRGIRFFHTGSDDRPSFTATAYVGGTPAFRVRNAGRGGRHDYTTVDLALQLEAQRYAKSIPRAYPFEPLDQLVDDLLDREIARRTVAPLLRDHLVFTLPGDRLGTYRKLSAPYGAASLRWIRRHYPQATIINEQLAADALAP
ncbi:hypothetical protein EPN42_11100 [bacterium]|nr:MAG: hypothetical protein EPN42_11100 [bacterium]